MIPAILIILTIHIFIAVRRMLIKILSVVINHRGRAIMAAYNIFPARELTVNTVAIYAKAMTFIQMLALSLPILRKTRDKIAATAYRVSDYKEQPHTYAEDEHN
jgi:hypothetical protein